LKIHEHQAREILRKHGVPVPPFEVASDPGAAKRAAAAFGGLVVVKAQVHAGGRGKAGGVKLAKDPAEAEAKAAAILGMTIKGLVVKRVIVARAVDIDREYYAGIVVDRVSKRPVVMVSAAGGVDIEEVARATPERIVKRPVDPEHGLGATEAAALAASIEERPAQARAVADVLVKLYRAFAESDCSLAEINPVVVTPSGEVWAVDAKMNIDDNALDRHPDLEALRDADSESREDAAAREAGLSYVKLDGNVGCLVNGAGLAMATMDLIKHYGGEPANFLDIGGSSSPEKVVTALDIITSDRGVRAILVNIFGGITRCDDVANGLVQALASRPATVPVVVRLTGTNEDRAREILSRHDLVSASSMDEAVQKAVELAGRAS
jgi:succinyl-CoA synthetase beta subunit